MSRHVIDKPRQPMSAERTRQFLNLQRAQNPDRASLMLQRRMRKRPSQTRVREYLRIDRGNLA
ncbi:hypothetical protein [Roseisalinus antarcticus]|uniref:Uncharacterized protein n=1 Tax=Roseisalinus antarcticus TaxID=254357 RepID=A0A1Y5SAA9_9RHOB|nr:hypothetical protein [Roseisalinus antarcticus]SLN33172.1 hypothetical protein ROA7023_01188 [Roseisalinus antarcticus]